MPCGKERSSLFILEEIGQDIQQASFLKMAIYTVQIHNYSPPLHSRLLGGQAHYLGIDQLFLGLGTQKQAVYA